MLSLALFLLLVSGCAPLSIRRRNAQSTECGHVNGNILTSPQYPYHYPTKVHCVYAIPLMSNKALKLKFVHFDIEPSAGCSYDYVEVKDNEVSYGRYCGKTLQGDDMVIDDTPYVYIVFHSDKTLTKTGFKMEFEHIDKGHEHGGHEVETVTIANTETVPLNPTTPFHPATTQPNNAEFKRPSTLETTYGTGKFPWFHPTTETLSNEVPTNPFTQSETSSNEATSEEFPTYEATPDVFPTNDATPDVFPTNEATPDVFPTNEATPDVFPTNEATPDLFATNEATPDVFPTNEATPDVFPTNEATVDVLPTNEAMTNVFPTNKYSQTDLATAEATKANPTSENYREDIPNISPDKRLIKPKISNDDSEEEPTNATDAMMTASPSSLNETIPTKLPMGNESVVNGYLNGSEGLPTGSSGGNFTSMQPTVQPEPTNYEPEPEKHVLDKLKLMALLQRIKFATLQMEELLIGNIVEEEVHKSMSTNQAKREMDDFRFGIDPNFGFSRRYKRKVKRDLGSEFVEEIRRIDQERTKRKRSKLLTKLIPRHK